MVEIEKIIHEKISDEIEKCKCRDYLGASQLGIECERQLWYFYHRPKNNHSAVSQMRFDIGNLMENLHIGYLKKAFTVYDVNDNGEQFGFVDGGIAGHCDGFIVIDDEIVLLEIKSMNKARFNSVKKHGVESKEYQYWVQMQTYMSKIFPNKIKNALFYAINKDTCEIYTEVIPIKHGVADVYITRAKKIIESNVPYQRKYSKSSFFKCRMCDYADECWDGRE